jgi:hypothetical protein
MEKRISRYASLEASFKGRQGSTSGCRDIEEEEEEEDDKMLPIIFAKTTFCLNKSKLSELDVSTRKEKTCGKYMYRTTCGKYLYRTGCALALLFYKLNLPLSITHRYLWFI